MREYDDAVLECFLDKQLQLFPEAAAHLCHIGRSSLFQNKIRLSPAAGFARQGGCYCDYNFDRVPSAMLIF